jgi:hypothetical protein
MSKPGNWIFTSHDTRNRTRDMALFAELVKENAIRFL